MEEYKIKKILIILFIVGIIFSCKKKDYRDDYVGDFKFTTEIKDFITDTTYTDSIISFIGAIGYGPSDNEISINYLPNSIFNVVLEKDGSFAKPSNAGQGYSSWGGFETIDKIRFGSGKGGYVGAEIIDVTGIRQ